MEQAYSGDLYKLADISTFLDETYGQSVNVLLHAKKFMKSVLTIQNMVGVKTFDEKKRFCLKKYMTSLRPRLHIAGYLQKRRFLPLRFQK